MPDSSKISSKVIKGATFSLASSIFSGLTLSIALSCGLSGFVPPAAQASDAGKTTQFFRAQAMQNIASGREEDALESYKSAIKVARVQYGSDSTYLSELYFEMGNLARSNGQSEIAQNCYKSAVKYRPNDIPARLQLADLERNTKNIREAFDDSKKAFQINQNSPIARKGLMLCLQQCGRPAEAAQIAATLHRSGKSTAKFANNLPSVPEDNQTSNGIAAPATPAPMVTNAVAVSTTSALHWAPDIKKKIDEAVAKKNKDLRAAEDAKKKQTEDLQKAENEKRNQHKKEEAERKAKQKSKKEEKAKKEEAPKDKKTSAKAKPAFVEPEVNSASLKTSAKTITSTKSDDKAEKAEKPASKGHLRVGAVTEKVEKPVEEKHESSVSENEPAKINHPQPERVQAAPAQIPSMPITMPAESKRSRPAHLGPKGLVPPPPATPFFAPSFPPPQGFQMQPQAAPPPKPRPPKPVKKEAPKDTSGEESATSSKGPSEDPDFLINWGGDSGKKKHSK